MIVRHILSSPVADFTGTVTVFNSAGVTVTANATEIVRPSDWNSAHHQYLTLGGNTAGASTLSGSNIVLQGGNNITLSATDQTLIFSAPNQSVQTQGMVSLQGSTGAIVFANSNGVSFGGNASTITASHDGLTTARASNDAVGLATALTANGVAWTVNSAGLSLNVPAFLTTAAVSNHSHGDPTLALTNLSGTTASNSNGLTLSLSAAAGAADGGVFISAGASSQSVGAIVFSNSNGLSFGLNNSTLTGSFSTLPIATGVNDVLSAASTGTALSYAPADHVHAGVNRIWAGSTLGNTLGDTTGKHGVWVIAASQNLTISGSTGPTGENTLFIRGPDLTPYLTTAAQSDHSHGNPTLALTNLNGTTASASNGFTLSLSAAAQSVVPGIQSIVFADTTFTTGAVSFSNANGISFGSSGGQVTASHNALTTARASTDAIGLNTALTANGVSMTANSSGLSLNFPAFLTTQSGQAFSADASSTFQTLSFQDSNGISFSNNAGALRITHGLQFTSATSAITASALNTSASRVINIVAATNNTGGGTGSLSSNVSFSNANGATFYSSAGGAIVLSYSVPNVAAFLTTARASNDALGLATAQTNVTWTANSAGVSLNAAGYAGTTTAVTGNAALTLNSLGLQFNGASLAGTSTGFGGTNISLSMTHNSAGLNISASVAAPGAGGGIAAAAGTQTATSGTVVFANSNNITFGMSGSTQVTASYSQSNQTANLYATGANSTQLSSTASVDLRSISVSGAGGVSAGVSQGVILISGPALTSLSVTGALSASSNGSTISLGVGTVTVSATSNTTNASSGTVNLNALIFKGQGAASVGISNGSIVIDAPSAAAGNVTFSAGAASAGLASIVFSNSNGVSFGLNGSTITASAVGGGGAGNVNLLGANTAGNTTATGSTLGFSGLNLTLSGTNASQIVFSAPAVSSLVGASGLSVSTAGSTISIYQPVALSRFMLEPPGASSAGSAMTQGSMSFQRVFVPDNLSFTRVDVPCLISLASSAAANTGVLLISSGLVIYTVSGTSTLAPVVGAFGTTTYTHASNTANFNSVSGPRLLSFPVATMLTAGEYYIGVQLSTNNNSSIGTATTALGATISLPHGPVYTASQWQEFGAVTATSVNLRSFVGVAASRTATEQTQQLSNITQTGTALMRANIPVIFRNF